MNIPTIGGTRGIFEIFIPGVFLLANLGGVAYFSPISNDFTRSMLASAMTNAATGLVVAICFGYLLGILLRLMRMEIPDNISALYLRRFSGKARLGRGKYKLYATEPFPYIGWLGEVCKEYLPAEATTFYRKHWAVRQRDGRNKQFFNYYKLLIASCDERAGGEVYAAEALTRYIAGMFYALTIATILIFTTALWGYFHNGETTTGLLIFVLAYSTAILMIIQNFRRIRIKEVETVFSASYLTYDILNDRKHGKKEEHASK